MNLGALLLASSLGDKTPQQFHGTRLQQSLYGNLPPEAAALGLVALQASLLARPPVPAQDLQQFGVRCPTVASILDNTSSLQSGLSGGGLSIPNSQEGMRGDPTNINALYRLIVNRSIGKYCWCSRWHRRQQPRVSGADSIPQALREQTIAEAAAANGYLSANEDGLAKKRFKRRLL